MKRKVGAGLAAVAVGAALSLAGPAVADSPPPRHGHILLLGANEAELTYRKCVDLAGGRHVPLHAHHANLHRGRAGMAMDRAGHAVIPTEHILPPDLQGLGILPANCAGVDAWLEGLRNGE